MKHLLALILLAASPATAQFFAKQAVVRVQPTKLSRDQELQLGRDAAKQVEHEMEVVRNAQVESWLNQIGQRLAKTPQANAYPYDFKLVNDDSINAFALPGGPMFVHTGLLKAADNEGEVVGVLAHEMSHVALRHGAAQATRQERYGKIVNTLGAVVGGGGPCGLLCQVAEAGVGLSENTILLKFSRGYEHDADLNGARMMSSAGFDPMQLPRFFQKMEATLGTASEPKGLALWMASHPPTGNRIQYVEQDIRYYPKRAYTASVGDFGAIKRAVATIPAPKPRPGTLVLPRPNATSRTKLPEGFKDYQARGFAIAYPGDWVIGQPAPGASLYIIPKGGARQNQDQGIELIAGAMVDYYVPQPGATVPLELGTRDFLAALGKDDSSLRAGHPEPVTVGGRPGLLTRVTTRTSLQQDPEQTIYLYTVARDAGLWYVVLAAPSSKVREIEPVFRQMVSSVAFPN